MAKPKKKKRWVWIFVAAAALSLIAILARPRPLRVDVAAVARGPLRVVLDEDGRTQVKRRYIVSTPLQGKLLRVELKAGDTVTEGSVLARLVPADAPLLDPRTRAEQEARLHAAEASVAQAEANVARARVGQDTAKDDLARKQKLSVGGAIAAHDLQLAENQAASSTQDLASAEFGAKVSGQQLAQARAALQRGRSGRVDEFEILAPAAGRVLRVLRESEGIVTAGTQLIEVGDPALLEVVAELLTVEAVKVRPGMPAFIDHWGGDRPLAARVRNVDPSGFTKISALGVEEQRVRVILDLTAPAKEWTALGDNFRVGVHIVPWESKDVLTLPSAALFRKGDAWATYAVDGNTIQLRRLELGQQSADLAEVKNGVQAGDRVVLRPSESLREGMKVEAVTPP
jgi:HlyD family secretion protein